MSATSTTQTELAVQRKVDERETITRLHEELMRTIEVRDGKAPSEAETVQMNKYRERAAALDEEIAADVDAVEREPQGRRNVAQDQARPRRHQRCRGRRRRDRLQRHVHLRPRRDPHAQLADLFADREPVRRQGRGRAGRERLELLKRTPANTLTSDIAGLNPAQHISQIFQVINTSRPIVGSALRSTLERGQLTYPQVDATPVVAVQATQKTEAGNTGMDISMVTATASTYLGGGDLSWQAIQWSTPNALDLWFRFCAADYALKTEQDAAQVLQHSGFANNISSTIAATPTFAQLMTAIGAGYADVFANSGRIADTVYMAPDRFGYLLGLTSDSFTQFTSVSGQNVGPLNIVNSRGMDAGVIVVGDRSGLLVAETGGAPVELRVVEPAIGGVEVGLIGAFEAVVVDDGAFAMITTAS